MMYDLNRTFLSSLAAVHLDQLDHATNFGRFFWKCIRVYSVGFPLEDVRFAVVGLGKLSVHFLKANQTITVGERG